MTIPRGPHPSPGEVAWPCGLSSPFAWAFRIGGASWGPGLPRPPRNQGPGWPCNPCCVPLASTRFPFPLIEFLHPLQPFCSYRKLPYHCGCTVQAETPTTPARENMVVNGPAEGRSDRLHCACARASPRPLPSRFIFQPCFLKPNGRKPRERWEPCLPRPHLFPALSWYLFRPPVSSVPFPVGSTLGPLDLALRWSRWESQIFLLPRPSPTGSNPRGFRSCAGIARCARSSAGTR